MITKSEQIEKILKSGESVFDMVYNRKMTCDRYNKQYPDFTYERGLIQAFRECLFILEVDKEIINKRVPIIL